eukprot:COSAG04_NODE_4466_length_2072_cov_1.530664_1_plen_222_part_10
MLALLACFGLLTQGVGPTTSNPTEFRWSYMPSYGSLRFLILTPPPTATHWSLELSTRGRSLNRTAGALPTAKVGETWMVGKLGAGEYTVHFRLTDGGSSGSSSVVAQHRESFNRTIRPFEHRRLGLEEVIIPPWSGINIGSFAKANKTAGTPITDGDRLGFMQPNTQPSPNSRVYTLGAAGLPKQITVTPPETPRENCTCCVGLDCEARHTECDKNLCAQVC